MLKVISLTVYLLGSMALANLDNNQVLPLYCGNANRAVNVCILGTLNGNEYISVSVNSAKPTIYTVVSKYNVPQNGRVGGSEQIYTGTRLVNCNGNECEEEKFELTIMHAVVPHPSEMVGRLAGETKTFVMNITDRTFNK